MEKSSFVEHIDMHHGLSGRSCFTCGPKDGTNLKERNRWRAKTEIASTRIDSLHGDSLCLDGLQAGRKSCHVGA